MARQRCTDRARGEAHRSGLRARKHRVHGRLAQAIASTHLVRPRLAVLTLARPAASLLACAARSYAWRLTPCQPRTTGEHCTHAMHVSPVPRTTAARHRNGRCAGCRPRSRGVAGVAARSHASRMWRRGGSDPQLRSPKMTLSRSMSGIAPGQRRHCAHVHNWQLLSTRPPRRQFTEVIRVHAWQTSLPLQPLNVRESQAHACGLNRGCARRRRNGGIRTAAVRPRQRRRRRCHDCGCLQEYAVRLSSAQRPCTSYRGPIERLTLCRGVVP